MNTFENVSFPSIDYIKMGKDIVATTGKNAYTEKEIRKEVAEWLVILYGVFGIRPAGPIESIKFNNRLRAALGRCKKTYGHYTLEFNPKFFQIASDASITEVILHEVLHTMPNCMKHTGAWLVHAHRCFNTFGVNVQRTNSDEAYGKFYQETKKNPENKYEVYCPKCNASWKYKKQTKAVQFPEKYRCGKCKCDLRSRPLVPGLVITRNLGTITI